MRSLGLHIIFLFLFVFTLQTTLIAQFDLVYSQTELNPMTINPAAAGSDDAFSVSLLSRNQWAGFPGAPVIHTINAHTPLKNTKAGMGFLLKRESYGIHNFFSFSFNYAYRMQFPIGRLAFGIKGGLSSGSTDIINLIEDQDDPSFYEEKNTYILPDLGLGAYFYSSKWYTGLSIPQIFSYEASGEQYKMQANLNFSNLYLLSGYHAKINNDFSLHPSVLIRYGLSNVFIADAKLNATFRDMVDAGVGYRTTKSVIVYLGYHVTNQFRVGYSYDLDMGEGIKAANGSHEIYLKYILGYKVKVANPRLL